MSCNFHQNILISFWISGYKAFQGYNAFQKSKSIAGFGILIIHDNHKLGLFFHHSLMNCLFDANTVDMNWLDVLQGYFLNRDYHE